MENEMIRLRKKRYQFHIIRDAGMIENLDDTLPTDEIRKYISFGSITTIGFIWFVALRSKIRRLYASSLRIGKKHLMVLSELHRQGKLDEAISSLAAL